MTEHVPLGIATIIIFGIMAQWLAWRLRIPSILLMLFCGFLLGPISGFLNPDALLGELLFPAVSMSVALILFEGGMSLKIAELQTTRHVVRNLITIGVLVTWTLTTAAAYYILGFAFPIALLFGAILIVTGPTVVIPLLKHVRANNRVGSIVKWEGIVNDPIGAGVAVLVFEGILVIGVQETATTVVIGLLETVIAGIVLGGLVAWVLILLLKRRWIPGYLQSSVTLVAVIGAFTASNLVHEESGLFTATLMGIILGNQKEVSVRHIIQFKENLGILLLSSLFIILAARLRPETLSYLGWHSVFFLVTMVLVVRPVSVWLSTLGSGLSWQERVFVAWMAPRGIVAAAVTSVFSLELAEQAGYTQAELMVPEMFLIIVGTVIIYGLSAAPLGRWLQVAQPNPQGVLIVGAHPWARAIGTILQAEGYQTLLVDTNRENINAARLEGIPTFYANILSEQVLDDLELGGLGRLVALTPNDEVNSLAALHFAEVFDKTEVYQLAPKKGSSRRDEETVPPPLRGHLLFAPEVTYEKFTRLFEEAGYKIKKTNLTKQFDYKAFQTLYGQQAIPLFLIGKNGDLKIFTPDYKLNPQPGDALISLADPTIDGLPSALPALDLQSLSRTGG